MALLGLLWRCAHGGRHLSSMVEWKTSLGSMHIQSAHEWERSSLDPTAFLEWKYTETICLFTLQRRRQWSSYGAFIWLQQMLARRDGIHHEVRGPSREQLHCCVISQPPNFLDASVSNASWVLFSVLFLSHWWFRHKCTISCIAQMTEQKNKKTRLTVYLL